MTGVKEVLRVRRYKAGYEVREEMVDSHCEDYPLIKIKNAYTPKGDWIGKSKEAYWLCYKRGIAPEKRNPEHCSCSIGWSKKEQKWYGWSHRALFGFEIGSKVTKGDCAYTPTDKKDFEEEMVRFWHDTKTHIWTKTRQAYQDEHHGIEAYWKFNNTVKNEELRGMINSVFMPYPDHYGRGEWEAKTLDDAKQMAIDFAEGVS